MAFLRFGIGTLLLAAGLLAFGLYAAMILMCPAEWDGVSANPAICYFQTLLFTPAGKPTDLAGLFWGGFSAVAIGAFLTRTIPHLLVAGAAACFGVCGAALACGGAARASDPAARAQALSEALPRAIERQGRDLGIVAGLGGSLLLIAVFLSFWSHWTASKKLAKKAKPAKAAQAAND